jgi:hypothetical protein
VFEHKSEPLLSHRDFLGRVARSVLAGALLVAVSLFAGMAGYHALEPPMSWLDAFLNAAMLLGGMGPVATPQTEGGKLFAGLYALYCGLVVLIAAGIILAPIAHRILHRFHLEERD